MSGIIIITHCIGKTCVPVRIFSRTHSVKRGFSPLGLLRVSSSLCAHPSQTHVKATQHYETCWFKKIISPEPCIIDGVVCCWFSTVPSNSNWLVNHTHKTTPCSSRAKIKNKKNELDDTIDLGTGASHFTLVPQSAHFLMRDLLFFLSNYSTNGRYVERKKKGGTCLKTVRNASYLNIYNTYKSLIFFELI